MVSSGGAMAMFLVRMMGLLSLESAVQEHESSLNVTGNTTILPLPPEHRLPHVLSSQTSQIAPPVPSSVSPATVLPSPTATRESEAQGSLSSAVTLSAGIENVHPVSSSPENGKELPTPSPLRDARVEEEEEEQVGSEGSDEGEGNEGRREGRDAGYPSFLSTSVSSLAPPSPSSSSLPSSSSSSSFTELRAPTSTSTTQTHAQIPSPGPLSHPSNPLTNSPSPLTSGSPLTTTTRTQTSQTSSSHRQPPTPRPYKTSSPRISSALPLTPLPRPITLSPRPQHAPQPRLEALMEDNDSDFLMEPHRQPDVDEMDYEELQTPTWLTTAVPTLSSRSLVSPVPVRTPPHRRPQPRHPYPVSSNPRTLARPRKVPAARPIPPPHVSPPHHIVLQAPAPPPAPPPSPPSPAPQAQPPLEPLPSSTPSESSTSQQHVAKVTPNPLFSPHSAPSVPAPPVDPQSRHEEYEEGYDYEYDEENDARFEVQTSEPQVLFVFDKPGYSPSPPTTMAPPTRSPTPSDPWDCAPRCPRYTLLEWNMDYDVRLYPDTLWVSTVIISENRVLAELEGYMRVQDYFYGLNDQGLVLNLTVPFVTQIKFGRHPGVLQETNDFTVSLYVQPSYYHLGELPTPISNEVLVDELEAKTVFVHSFEANVWEVTDALLEEKVKTFMAQLRQHGEAFLDRYYYLASYSRPELYQTVYYEIWIYATNFRNPQPHTKAAPPQRRPRINKVTQRTLTKLCRGVECPRFEVLRTFKYGIQKRRYFDALFASTSPDECHFTTTSIWKGFMPLHLYKHGINSHMEVLEATRPIALVHVRTSPAVHPECPQNLTMSLYLPRRLHSNPPQTGYSAPKVHMTSMNDVIVYAYTVGGYLLEPARVRQELADLKHRLSEFGACYRDDEHYVVIYDFIVRYHGRQNEIWVLAENCKATHNG
ncbi:uncharacterized protein LOC123511298 isoform X2 [Portunus trituberculatus]|uniref:uncharacterized protein LOC123511298 isoform X2 n=1 Tax=Portunus trituberculatus TaxID=210409 RepID=UPI001E1CD008|nr:uncharacterized protein LOC123511298 isoform X2 [Portunus trituberculatus]XP_045123008.1 uncharacterized protein LOC123511298 isoform X2 [Portunus trituberculatus]